MPTIRPARKDDINALLALEQSSFPGDRLNKRQFRHLLSRANADLLVAEMEGTVVADVVVLYNRATSNARLYSIAVDNAHRGQGIARALVEAAEQSALDKGRAWMRLEVRKDNPASMALFQALGYRRFGEYRRYYEDDQDAWRYEKTLHADTDKVGPGDAVPYYEQSLDFTCGAASLMMAMAALDADTEISRRNELRLWREATTVFMTSGHGGCGPYGLALAALRRGFAVEVFVSETEVHFGDSVRDADKKAVIELVQADMEDDLTTAGVPIRAEALELEHLRFVLERGALVLALISSWQIYESRTPHWVLITAMDEQFVFVNDPFVDRDKQESPIDSIQIPISFDTFQRISRYGRRALRAAVVLFPSAKLLPT